MPSLGRYTMPPQFALNSLDTRHSLAWSVFHVSRIDMKDASCAPLPSLPGVAQLLQSQTRSIERWPSLHHKAFGGSRLQVVATS